MNPFELFEHLFEDDLSFRKRLALLFLVVHLLTSVTANLLAFICFVTGRPGRGIVYATMGALLGAGGAVVAKSIERNDWF